MKNYVLLYNNQKMKKIILLLTLFFSSILQSQNLDINLLKDINHSYTKTGGKMMIFITDSDDPVSFGLPIGLAINGLITKDKSNYVNSLEMLSTSLVSSILTTSLKFAFNRPRPFVTYPNDITQYAHAGSKSFPSGHTSFCFATATSFSLLYPKWYVVVPMYTWASLVGYSRMYLGVHYPSDVLFGAIVGSASAIGTHYLFNYVKKKREAKKVSLEL